MKLVTKMFGHLVPIIGFLMREETGKEEKLSGYTNSCFVYSPVVGGEMKRRCNPYPERKKIVAEITLNLEFFVNSTSKGRLNIYVGARVLNFKKFTKN